jgi:hypothetical protein
MQLSSAPGTAKPVQRSHRIVWVLGCIVCYQVFYHCYISFILRKDIELVDPWCAGLSRTAEQCEEAQLFHGWEHLGVSLEEPEQHGLLQPIDAISSHVAESPSTTPLHLDIATSQSLPVVHVLQNQQVAAVAINSSRESDFANKVAGIGRDLCSDPRHRNSAECLKFLAPAQNAASKAWHESLAAKIASVGRELCSNPFRHDYLACEQFDVFLRNSTSEVPKVHKAKKTELTHSFEDADENAIEEMSEAHHKDLLWINVEKWKTRSTRLRGATSAHIVSLTTEQVSNMRTFAHWLGRIPSVACVTLIPKDGEAKAWLPYFVDNFRLQNYEGDRQLILVYHHSDTEAASAVHKYANSTDIQVASAHGEDFPSAIAFRFGAYLAKDKDIIARWDFGAWHHPQRLSAQVRAMAYSGRPACLLKQWTLLDNSGANVTTVEGVFWDSSLVGETNWMRSMWYPLLGKVQQVSGAAAIHLAALDDHVAFKGQAARQLVTIETPGLEVFDEAWRW